MSVVTVTLRRFLRTSPPYVRRVATSAAADIFAQSPLSKGVEAATTLQDFMREAADVHDYTQQENEQKPTLIAFQSQAVVRPIDMHREFVRKYPESTRSDMAPGREARYTDVFLQLNIDPRREADNPKLMSDYVTHMGRIHSRNMTGLTQRSQRLLGKAIKRAKMMGVIPMMSNATIERDMTRLRK